MKKHHINVLIIGCMSLFFSSLFTGCNNQSEQTKETSTSHKQTRKPRDLATIKKDGKLTALTTYSNTSYFLYRGQPMGFEYELLKLSYPKYYNHTVVKYGYVRGLAPTSMWIRYLSGISITSSLLS